MNQALEQLVLAMADVVEDGSLVITKEYDDKTIEVCWHDNDSCYDADFVLHDLGTWNNHSMIEIREEPAIIVNAIPAIILDILQIPHA